MATTAETSSPSALIDARIAELGDWRGETLARVRSLIKAAVPDVTEAWKWRGVPVWERSGIICTGETYKQVVKLTFHKGASLPDPAALFNASLDGNQRRAIDIREGDKINERALKALVRAAAALNAGPGAAKATMASKPEATAGAKQPRTPRKNADGVVLLSGGNPQIAKGDGDAPVQAYISALSGWQQDVCRRVDALVVRTVLGVRKAVKWNSPFYGVERKGWFLSFHVFSRYVKVTFFAGASLRPLPPGAGKDPAARWVDIYDGQLDEAQLAKWVKQAAKIRGWVQ